MQVNDGWKDLHSLPLEGEMTVGRAKDNAMVISDTVVSRHHGRFYPSDESFRYEDLGSSNKSRFIRGDQFNVELHASTAPLSLQEGDEIYIAEKYKLEVISD